MTDRPAGVSRAVPAELLLRDVWSMGDLALIDELVSADHVYRDPIRTDPVRGRAELKSWVAMYRRGIPDLRKVIDDAYVSNDRVVITYTLTGTHRGPIFGLAPTDHTFAVDGVFVSHLVANELVETTELWNAHGLVEQLERTGEERHSDESIVP